MKQCSGYDADNIIDKVKDSALKVHKGLAVYERDSVIYNEIQYNYPLLAGLMWAAAKHNGQLHVLDFGGSLGSTYYQNKQFLDVVPDLQWSIVEQPAFVQAGLKDFTTGRLKFYYSINDCIKSRKVDVVLLSSVLPYLASPYDLLEDIITRQIETIIIDRTPFIKGEDRLTVQKVHPGIYKARYPCWFFNLEKFLFFMESKYDIILEFDALDRANIPSEFKGFIFRKK